MKKAITPLLAVALFAVFAAGASAQETYEITVTNLNYGQPLAPPLVVAHNSKFALFTPGKKGFPQLGTLAETGNPEPLGTRVAKKNSVMAVAMGDSITMPGNSITLMITVDTEDAPYLSVATMLGATNDAFAGLRGVKLVDGAVYWAPAWDAGSEENTEAIGDVGALGGGNARKTANAEKFVHIHRGIQGIADQAPEMFDWRNPVAMISIKKVN